MRVAAVATVYNEARFLPKYLGHMPDWVEEKVVLLSTKPWYGEELPDDGSAEVARKAGATVIPNHWTNEVDQRNAGQDYLSQYDWILNLEPDEFLDNANWEKLHKFIESNPPLPAYAVKQEIYWGRGFRSDPPEDFVPIILTRPSVKFIDKRVIDSQWAVMPDIFIHHFAWARSDEEIYKKVSHYSHAVDFDVDKWFKEVWMARKTENVHPTTPEAIPRLVKANLPKEIAELRPWPNQK